MARNRPHLLNRARARTLAVLGELFADHHPRNFAIRLWDGSTWEAEPSENVRFTLVLRHPGALRRMLLPGTELTISEAYLYDDFDIEGEIVAVLATSDRFLAPSGNLIDRLRRAKALLSLPSERRQRLGRQAARLNGFLHSKQRDSQAVSYHYNLSNEFYSLWLDRWMVYSCAYFHSPNDTLDRAQEQKMEYICRKLRLNPGQRLLDIGCGWGALVIFAGQRYGVEALGVTLSQPQADLANERIAQAGLASRCRVKVLDYRDLDERERYDRLVSVGMFEHVGQLNLSEYFRRAWVLLRPGGVFLNHGISFMLPQAHRRGPTFFDRYVFPDGELVPLSTTLRAAEASGLEVRDVESLREHYVLTLQHWLRRLEARHEEVLRIADEVTYRVWRLYMAAAIHQFAVARTTVYQILLSKPHHGTTELPLTRSDLYS